QLPPTPQKLCRRLQGLGTRPSKWESLTRYFSSPFHLLRNTSQTMSPQLNPRPLPIHKPMTWIPWEMIQSQSHWLGKTFPFYSVGKDVSVHFSVDMRRRFARRIQLGDSVIIAEGAWLNVAIPEESEDPAIVLDDRVRIGRRCMLSARNCIHLESDVSVAPSVLIMDHNHAYEDPTLPVEAQGLTAGGRIRIEQGAWIGHGAAIVCNEGELAIGRNCVIAANSFVTRSFPPFCVIAGNPARIV